MTTSVKKLFARISLVAPTLLLVLICACERQRAQQRVFDALNPGFIDVTNGEVAVLKIDGGYLAVIPDYRSHDHIQYSVFFSCNGVFSVDRVQVLSAVAPRQEVVDYAGVRLFIGYGGVNTTSVSLNTGDTNTGLAKTVASGFDTQDVSALKFHRSAPLSRDDVKKAF